MTKRNWIQFSTVLAMLAIAIASSLILQGDNAQNLPFSLFTILRCTLGVGFITLWSIIVRFLANRFQWNQELLAFAQQQRWRVAGWLVIIELVVVQNIFLKLINFMVP